MTCPLLDQYALEDIVQFLALKPEPGLRTKLQLVNRHIQLFVRKIMSKRTYRFETNYDYATSTDQDRIIKICSREPRIAVTELFNQITDGTLPPPPDYFHFGVVKIFIQDLCPELEAILLAFKSAFRGCVLWINYGYHSHDGNFPAPFTTQAQLIRILREMFEIFTDVTAIRLFGYNLSNYPLLFTPQADSNNFMDLAEFLKVCSLDIHLKKSLGKNLTVPFNASHPQISEEDIFFWLHANSNSGQNSRLVPRKMNVELFYLNLSFIVKIVKMISEIFFASTDLCSFNLSMKSKRDNEIMDQKSIAAGLIQLFSSHSPDIFSTSIFPGKPPRLFVHQLALKNKTTNETLAVEIHSQKVTVARAVQP